MSKRWPSRLDRSTIDQLPFLLLRTLVPEGAELLHRQLLCSRQEIAGHASGQRDLAFKGKRSGLRMICRLRSTSRSGQ
jgi:hypothetical protein